MNGSNGRATGRRGIACGVLALMVLAGCGGDGAGADAGASGSVAATQSSPSGGSGTGATAPTLVVSGAVPATGNGTVALGTAVTTTSGSTFRQATIEGNAQATGTLHRITVDFDSVTGTVAAVTHRWGPSATTFEAITQCARTASTVAIACGGAVSVDVATGRVSYTNLVLRGSGAFTSILNGQFTTTTP